MVGAGGAGCSHATVQGQRQDPSFTYESVSQGGIGIGAVTWLGGADTSSRVPFENALRAQLLEVRPESNVMSAAAVAGALGEEAYARIVGLHERTGELDSVTLAELATRLEAVRYVVLASIEHEAVDSTRKETRDTTGRHESFTTSRRLSLGLRVYDLRLGLEAWGGRITNAESEMNSYGEHGLVIEVIEAVVGWRGYPDPPSRLDVAEDIFETFAKHLPRPPKAR